jgi:HNH endonuclease
MQCETCPNQLIAKQRRFCSWACRGLGNSHRNKRLGICPPSQLGNRWKKTPEQLARHPKNMLRPEVVAKAQATKRSTFNICGRKSKEREIFKKTPAYIAWRRAVFERDNYTCVFCGIRGVELQADHIKPYSLYPDLRVELSNGRTLCKPCHKSTPTYGGKLHKMVHLVS